MKFDKVQFVYIDMDYLKKLNEIESEILKHKTWDDVTASWYRIYEIIEKAEIRDGDIIVDIKNQDILNKIEIEEQANYKQRILAVLDIRKMFPVKKGVYTKIRFEISTKASKKENQRMALMMKEYSFILNICDKIEEKASKIYRKQIEKNKILKYHCDYSKLEKFADEYETN